MSLEISSLVMKCFPFDRRLKLLAISMADAAMPCGGNIFKANMTYSTDASCSKATVIRAIRDLIAAEWLMLVGDNKGGAGRTNVYRINPDWIAAAHYEMALAASERRQPRPVSVPKGVNLTPFLDEKRVSNPHEKGVKNEKKGVKNSQKGVIQVLPEHRTLNNITNNPLPPKGGEPAVETKSGDALPTEEKPSDADALLAKLIAIHPKHDPAHTPSARRALAKITDPAQRAQLAARLRVDATTIANWQTDGGRFAPKLSKWLAGTAELLALPASERPADAEGKDAIEARAVGLGLGKFDDWMVQQSIAGKSPSWALYCRAANGGAA